MLAPVLITAPAVDVVTFDEASIWLRGDGVTDEKALVEALIASATAHLDGWSGILGRCLINQVWAVPYKGWSRELRLPFPNVSAATVKYYDANNVEQTVAGADMAVLHDAEGSYVRLSDDYAFPNLYDDRDDAVNITLTAGYGTAATAVPAPIRTAILLMVAHWFHNREAVADSALAELPMGVSALITPYRRIGV